jgi:AcrR family transcriptional regulator
MLRGPRAEVVQRSAGGERVPRRRGRPPRASRDDVLARAREEYLRGHRVDLTLVARSLGLGRATIYRWFGSRDDLLGEVLAGEVERLVAVQRARVRHRGARGLLEVFDRVNRSLARSTALRTLLEQERDGALRLLTSGGGPVQPRAVACVQELIDAEVSTGTFRSSADTGALAYALVRLAEAFLYNDVAIGIRGDWERLHQVEAALLGVPSASDGPGEPPGRSSADEPPAVAS